MFKVRLLIGVIVLVFAAWSGWWWFGAQAHRQALQAWLDDRRADGWVAETGEISVVGYPSRFDAALEDVRIADPRAGWSWSAPEFRTFMLAYQPNKVIASWPTRQVVAAPGERIDIASETMRASLALVPDTGLELDRAVMELARVDLISDLGWTAALDRGQLSVRRSAEERGRANAYDAVLEGAGLRPPSALRDLLGGGAGLPEAVDDLRVDLTAAFDAPIDRRAAEGAAPALETLWLRSSRFVWGALTLEASGRLDIDAAGVPDGKLSLRARNWRALLEAAVASGAVERGAADTLRSGLELLSMLSSEPDALEAPLRFANGLMFIGPVPIGQAPRLAR